MRFVDSFEFASDCFKYFYEFWIEVAAAFINYLLYGNFMGKGRLIAALHAQGVVNIGDCDNSGG